MKLSFQSFVLLASTSAFLIGCGSGNLPVPEASPTGVNQGPKFKGPPSDAGLTVAPSTDATQFPKLVKAEASKFGKRTNPEAPFMLTSNEKAFDSEQTAERVFNSTGFTTLVEAKSEVAPVSYVEPQPYRRLSGVVVGDSVVAIIEMGEGQVEIIRPGMKIPNSPWTVVSIDQDKAVLRRDGNVLPHEIEVRLEVDPNGSTGASSGTGVPGGFRGGPGGPGGFPGGGPGGFPGGGPGRAGGFPGGRGRLGGGAPRSD